MTTVEAKIHVDHEAALNWGISTSMKNCIHLTMIKIVRKEDQYHSGDDREVLLTKQDIYFDSAYDLTKYCVGKDGDKVMEYGPVKTVNLTKSKLLKFVNTVNEAKKTLNDFGLDYSNGTCLKSTLSFMQKKGWNIGKKIGDRVDLTQSFPLKYEGGMYVDAIHPVLSLDSNDELGIAVLMQRLNSATGKKLDAKSIAMSVSDVNAFYEKLFSLQDVEDDSGFWIHKYFPSLTDKLQPLVFDVNGVQIIEDNEEQSLKGKFITEF